MNDSILFKRHKPQAGKRRSTPACQRILARREKTLPSMRGTHVLCSLLSRGIVKHPFFLARPTDTWQTPKDPNTCFQNIGSISKRKIPGGLQGIVDAYGNEGNQVNRKKGRCWEVKGGPQLQCPTREGQQKQSRWTPPEAKQMDAKQVVAWHPGVLQMDKEHR